jgi:hypothetical protein
MEGALHFLFFFSSRYDELMSSYYRTRFIAPNLHTCEHWMQPAQSDGSIFILKRPGAVSSPRVIAGHPSLKHIPHALHFS